MSFISATTLKAQREERKEQKRQSRQKILEEAREKFLEEKKRQELKRERGDDVWVAPGISKRLSLNKKPKKHKKDKKHKKEKAPKNDESVAKEASDDSEEDNEDVWVVKGEEPQEETTPLQRDDWMKLPLAPSVSSRRRLEELADLSKSRDREKEEKSSLDQPGHHPLELNPYWREGGTGLPQEESSSTRGEKRRRVGDGGRSWLLRAYKRALERVEEEGKSLEEIASQQWGSVEKLYSMLEECGIDPKNPDGPFPNKRYLYSHMERESDRRRERVPPPRILKPTPPRRKEKGGFMKPSFGDDEERPVGPSSQLLMGLNDSGNWRKKVSQPILATPSLHSPSPPPSHSLPHSHSPSPPPVPRDEPTVSSDAAAVTLPPPAAVTSTQLNSIAAKLMKAEMLGDQAKVDKLKAELQKLQDLKETQERLPRPPVATPTVSKEREEQVVVLTKTDRYGNTRPVGRSSSSQGRVRGDQGRVRGEPRGSTHTEKGKRKKYFPDDDQHTLRSLMEQERFTTAEETHYAIAKMASKFVPSSNADETIDDALDSASATRSNPRKEEERALQRTLNDNRKMAQALDNCKLCFDNSGFEKHLLIAVGISVYLCLPAVQSLTEGHCLIVPMEHTPCSLQVDENVWSEISIFRKGLTRMFSDRQMDVVFMEMYTRPRGHMIIECIPLPQEEVGELAPMYFKKAIQESDKEWSDNKKLIDTSKKGIRGSLPVGLSYFSVQFGIDGSGYAHIIEDSSKFPHYFGKEVCGGMLDVEPRLWLSPHRESFERQKEKVVRFSEWWTPYDWTQRLKEDN